MIIEESQVFIYSGIKVLLTNTSQAYKSANVLLLGIAGVFLGTLIIEFGIMFSGMTMFNDKLNLTQIFFHIIGCTTSTLYILRNGHYNNLWKIWIVGGIIPMIIEVISVISAKVHYKRIIKENN